MSGRYKLIPTDAEPSVYTQTLRSAGYFARKRLAEARLSEAGAGNKGKLDAGERASVLPNVLQRLLRALNEMPHEENGEAEDVEGEDDQADQD